MLRLLLLLTAVVTVYGGDALFKKYAFTKVMTNCFGEDIYYKFRHDVIQAAKECYMEDINLPNKDGHDGEGHGDQSGHEVESHVPKLEHLEGSTRYGPQPVFLPWYVPQQGQVRGGGGGAFTHQYHFPGQLFQRQKREVMFDASLMEKMMHVAKAQVSNYTCVLQKMNYLHDDFSLNYDFMEQEYRDLALPMELKEDLIQTISLCRDFTMCMPFEDMHSPMPEVLKRVMAFTKCEKKARFKTCMKHDFMKHLEAFDLSSLPDLGDNDAEVAEAVMHVFWGVESKGDLELY